MQMYVSVLIPVPAVFHSFNGVRLFTQPTLTFPSNATEALVSALLDELI